ncbi:hypothetical protein PMIN04_006070 [Paraphaeosphaeria minitans]
MGRILSILLSQCSIRSRKSNDKGKNKMPRHPNPNPTPALYPHPSSFKSLCEYTDDDTINQVRNYNDDDMEYFRADHEFSREWCPIHHVGGSVAATAAPQEPPSTSSSLEPSNRATASSQESRATPLSSNCSLPTTPTTQDLTCTPSSSTTPPPPPPPSHPEPVEEPCDLTTCTAINAYLSPYQFSFPVPLSLAQRAEIEVFIPDTILRLPTMVRPCALSAWAKHMQNQQLSNMRAMVRQIKKRKRSKQKLTVLPWDEGVDEWNGSFAGEAREIVKVSGEEGLYTRVAPPQGDGNRKNSDEGNHANSVQEKQGERERCLDVNDGHVIGRDWACGRSGPVILLYEERDGGGEEQKVQRNSLFDRTVQVVKRAVIL